MSTKKVLIIAVVSFLILITIVGVVFGILMLKNDKSGKEVPLDKKYFNVGEMYSNLKDSNRIVKIKMTIEITGQKLDEELVNQEFESKKFLIKNEINQIIRNKTEKDVEGSNGQLTLQKEITGKLINLLDNTDISNVYFEELIVQ